MLLLLCAAATPAAAAAAAAHATTVLTPTVKPLPFAESTTAVTAVLSLLQLPLQPKLSSPPSVLASLQELHYR
jgi:hypothetical protein